MGVVFPLVVKVGNTDQPALIRLDLMVAGSMNVDVGAGTMRINNVWDAQSVGDARAGH